LSVEEKFQANEEEKSLAEETLKLWLDFDKKPKEGAIFLREILDRSLPGVESMYAGLSYGLDPTHVKIKDDRIPKLVIDLFQIELLKDKEIRRILLKKMTEKDPQNPIFDINKYNYRQRENNEDIFRKQHTVDDLVNMAWAPGGPWARKFVKAFGFPDIFAGIGSHIVSLPVEDIEGPILLPKLEDFQDNIKQQVLELLSTENGKYNRGIIRLPTGAGKTRVMVEALLDFWKGRSGDMRYMVWIAQTDELCEQAFESFRQVWTVNGIHGERLRLFRFWGNGRRLPNLYEDGIIIAGVSKLYEDTDDSKKGFASELQTLTKHIAAVVVDEAHRSITKMYNSIFRILGIKFPASGEKQIPLIGLTATPYRGYNVDDTRYLLNKYNGNILYPRGHGFDEKQWSDWNALKNELTRRGILSRPEHEPLLTDIEFRMDDDETRKWIEKNILEKKFLSRLGIDYRRNKIIFNKLIKLANNYSSILYFGTSVNNANIITALLRDKNIPTAVITGSTSSGIRQTYIRKFKEQKIKILCNYGVLTTGFDAPKIDAILIARPTESPNLYEQMIGRGLRGKKFGGKDKCLIVDIVDNIYLHKYQHIQERFTDGSVNYWNAMEKGD